MSSRLNKKLSQRIVLIKIQQKVFIYRRSITNVYEVTCSQRSTNKKIFIVCYEMNKLKFRREIENIQNSEQRLVTSSLWVWYTCDIDIELSTLAIFTSSIVFKIARKNEKCSKFSIRKVLMHELISLQFLGASLKAFV